MSFKKAVKNRVKLKLAITGPSGSGKTYSALMLAKGIGCRIALMDTENKSASLYANKFEFDSDEISPPYTMLKYQEGMKSAVTGGYDVLVMDSITHAWAGEGGLLDKKATMDATGSNSFNNWKKITPEQERFVAQMLYSDIHLIATMRSKQEYILVEGQNSSGKTVQMPKKVGMAPIQREGVEYEFTVVFDLDTNHMATVSKDRTGLFDGLPPFRITEETGKTILNWLNDGEVVPIEDPKPETAKVEEKSTPTPPLSSNDRKDVMYFMNSLKEDEKAMAAVMIKAAFRDCKTTKDVMAAMKSLKQDEKAMAAEWYNERMQELTGV